ncbi:MAG: hypothetical protein ACXVFL_04620 [Solirubrobacteraceae bacterium]
MRRPTILLILLCAAAALLPAAAHASHSQSTTLDAPRDLLDDSARPKALDDAAALGVKSLRIVLTWQTVAPASSSRVKPKFDATDPGAYDWGHYDALVAAARQRGWSVLMTPSGPVPRWATNGAKDNLTRPRPNEFRMFVQAAAAHFGAKVDTWSIWNEANQPQFLMPQYSIRHQPLSPRIYRNLFFAAVRGLRNAGQGDKPLLIGETSPRGTGKVVPPLTFLREMLCLDSRYRRAGKCAAVPATGYAHHAYTTGQGPTFHPPEPNDVTIGVLSRLTRALDRAAKAGAVKAHLPIWLTEFGIESVPDPLRGVSLMQQSEYRSISERIAYDNPRVVSFNQYLLRDDLPKQGVPKIMRYPGFETGLFSAGGKVKPSFDGFRLPLVAWRTGSKVSLWGLVRPAAGPTKATVEISSDKGRTWRTLGTYTTDARGYFTRTVSNASGRRWRLVWTAPDGTTYRGSQTRAYSR